MPGKYSLYQKVLVVRAHPGVQSRGDGYCGGRFEADVGDGNR